MTIKQAAGLLKEHNAWRRGDDSIGLHKPADIGKALDIVCKHILRDAK